MKTKKILAMACLLCGGLFVGHAQEAEADTTAIALDSVDMNGVRHIVSTDYEIYRLWTTDAAFNLSYADVPGDTTPYRLNIAFNEGKFTMAPGKNKLILKLKKVKVPMELYDTRLVKLGQNDYVEEETKDGTYYYITPAFAISEAQIQQLAASKVIKFRVVHERGKFDREDKDNVIPAGLKTAYEAIQFLLAADSAVMTDTVVPAEPADTVAALDTVVPEMAPEPAMEETATEMENETVAEETEDAMVESEGVTEEATVAGEQAEEVEVAEGEGPTEETSETETAVEDAEAETAAEETEVSAEAATDSEAVTGDETEVATEAVEGTTEN